jgi:hypothetical protein
VALNLCFCATFSLLVSSNAALILRIVLIPGRKALLLPLVKDSQFCQTQIDVDQRTHAGDFPKTGL